jgi:hypothetical protein
MGLRECRGRHGQAVLRTRTQRGQRQCRGIAGWSRPSPLRHGGRNPPAVVSVSQAGRPALIPYRHHYRHRGTMTDRDMTLKCWGTTFRTASNARALSRQLRYHRFPSPRQKWRLTWGKWPEASSPRFLRSSIAWRRGIHAEMVRGVEQRAFPRRCLGAGQPAFPEESAPELVIHLEGTSNTRDIGAARPATCIRPLARRSLAPKICHGSRPVIFRNPKDRPENGHRLAH